MRPDSSGFLEQDFAFPASSTQGLCSPDTRKSFPESNLYSSSAAPVSAPRATTGFLLHQRICLLQLLLPDGGSLPPTSARLPVPKHTPAMRTDSAFIPGASRNQVAGQKTADPAWSGSSKDPPHEWDTERGLGNQKSGSPLAAPRIGEWQTNSVLRLGREQKPR